MESLNRFRSAQADPVSGFEAALAEIKRGHKRGHWIWYVFPQLGGLGHSSTSQMYGIRDRTEAEAYLEDADLRDRLLAVTKAAAKQLHGASPLLDRLMGSEVDSLKLVSSLTLFGTVARQMHLRKGTSQLLELAEAADDVLGIAAAQGYPPCRFTLETVGAS